MERLGAIRKAAFVFCQYSSRYDSFKEGKEHNIFRRECSAGALMDIGVYSVHMMLQLLGKPEAVQGLSVMLRGDIDGAGTILAKYPDKIAEVSYSKITNSALPNELQGENGVLQFHGSANSPENVKIIFRDGKEELLHHRETENDMKYELEIVKGKITTDPLDLVEPVMNGAQLLRLQDEIHKIYIHDAVYQYIGKLVNATRKHSLIELGISPRGTIALARMVQALAYLRGRNYVLPVDVEDVFIDVEAHRIQLNGKARVNRVTAEQILKDILEGTTKPSVVRK